MFTAFVLIISDQKTATIQNITAPLPRTLPIHHPVRKKHSAVLDVGIFITTKSNWVPSCTDDASGNEPAY